MSRLIDKTGFTYSSTPFIERDEESLLSKILNRLKAISTGHHPKADRKNQHQSFLEANLLDKFMGPEISRTLRR